MPWGRSYNACVSVTRDSLVRTLQSHAAELRGRFHVKSLGLFGSGARDEATATSDVDLVVEFQDAPSFDTFMDLKFHLEDLLGRRVDLVTREALRPALRSLIERETVRVA